MYDKKWNTINETKVLLLILTTRLDVRFHEIVQIKSKYYIHLR